MSLLRLFSRAVVANRAGSRSMFTSSKSNNTNPNWVAVGAAYGTTVAIWALLFKQHSRHLEEYKERNGLE